MAHKARDEARRRNQIAVIGPDAHRPKFLAAPNFDWVGRGDFNETKALPPDGMRHVQHARHEIIKDAHRRRAMAHLKELPEPGVALHMLCNASFNFLDFLTAVLKLAHPRTATEFYAASWVMNREAIETFFNFFDRGVIGSIGLITGEYWKRWDPQIFAYAYEGLRTRNQRMICAPNHSKWFLLRLSDGSPLVTSGSANFTQNGGAEQATITNDEGLFQYYRGWAEELLGKAEMAEARRADRSTPLPAFESQTIETGGRGRRPGALTKAGLGAYYTTRNKDDWETMLRWKKHRPLCREWGRHFGEQIARAVKLIVPEAPAGTIVTTPPQGSSAGTGENASAILAAHVAEAIGAPLANSLERTDTKRFKGMKYTLRQKAFHARQAATKPTLAIVIDDITTTGTTLRLAIEALRREGITTLGFTYA